MPRVRPMVGETAYGLAGIGSRWSRRGAMLLGRIHRSLRSESETTTGMAFRVRRVAGMSRLRRMRTRAWLAWVLAWRTKWAPFDWYVTAESGGRNVSIAGIVDRRGAIGSQPTHLALLGGVYTRPEFRHHGLASEVVRRATRFLTDALGADFGVLICTDALVPFYERLGWRVAPGGMIFRRFGETGRARGNVMVYESAGRPLPPGVIDVRGLPA